MRFADLSPFGRIATRLATWGAPPYTARRYLARMSPRGYVDPAASLHHGDLHLGEHVFIADRVVIHQEKGGGRVELGNRVHLYRDCIVVTGDGGSVTIGSDTHIQPRCQLMGFKGSIRIGRGVQVAPNCAMYSYDHGFAPGEAIRRQPLRTRGGIEIEDEAWLGVGVIVLDGVSIGRGAVIGAGSVVTRDVPEEAIAAGVPARIIKRRTDLLPRAGGQT